MRRQRIGAVIAEDKGFALGTGGSAALSHKPGLEAWPVQRVLAAEAEDVLACFHLLQAHRALVCRRGGGARGWTGE